MVKPVDLEVVYNCVEETPKSQTPWMTCCFWGIARECVDVRELAERTDRTVQSVYRRLRKIGLRPEDIGETPALEAALARFRKLVMPHRCWLQSLIGGR